MNKKDKKSKFNSFNRRQFLRGSGGFVLALPMLSSLLPKAFAQQAGQKRFVGLFSGHGQAFDHWYPSVNVPLRNVVGYQRVRGALLSSFPPGQISGVIGPEFNPYRNDLLLLSRLTPPAGSGQHHTSQMLGGSTAPNNQNTIDQIMGKVPAMTAGTREAVLNLLVSESGGYYSNNSMSRLNGNDVPSIANPQVAFRKVFCDGQPGGDTGNPSAQANSKKVVDMVLDQYKSVLNGGKLSTEDKETFTRYIASVDQLETKLFSTTGGSASGALNPAQVCNAPPAFQALPLNGNVGMAQLVKNNLDVIALAIKSGSTNIATLQFHPHDYHASNFGAIDPMLNQSTHEQIGHSNGEAKRRINAYFASQMAYLIGELKQVENQATGETFLYNSLIYWGNDQGTYKQPSNHGHKNQPVLLAGQAGGALTTGRVIDYGNAYADGVSFKSPDTFGQNGYTEGRPFNQLLVTIMKSMGLTANQYESTPGAGFSQYGNEAEFNIPGEVNDGVTDKGLILPGVSGEAFQA